MANALQADQLKTVVFPQGNLMGDWKRGEAIAQSGRGLTWNDKAGEPAGGSCYNCHQLSPKELSHGTIGPSLRGFGKARGNGAEIQRYVYGKIYNAKAYNLCSQMPRLGLSGTLTPEQIKHLVGEAQLKRYGMVAGTAQAHAFSHLDFEGAALRYGRMGGYAHLATLVRRLLATRPHALLLDGGDSWQGSATALWTQGADMIGAQKRLGVQYMTAHWEFTYGAQRMLQAVKDLAPVQFLAQNVRTVDFEDPVFTPYAMHDAVAIIGQAFPYTPIAHPRHRFPDWSFGIQEGRLQKLVDEARGKGARAVVLLSHNGMDVDLKLAARVRGIDAILGGHTHDGVPAPVRVGKTLVTNAGSHGKFVGVLDLQVERGGVRDYRYRLLPVFANLLPPDAAMAQYIEEVRAPHAAKLGEKLAVTEGLLYRRGNFNGTFD